jgi:hypothetical protein
MRPLYRKCKQHLGKEIGQGLFEIIVPLNPQELPTKEVQHWTRESDRAKVTRALLDQNERHFQQSWNTPFATGPLAKLIGHDGTSPYAHQIMNGTSEVNDPLPDVMEFIQTFKKHPNISPLNQEITASKFKKDFLKIHGKKASFASGRHIGYYKAATTSDTISKTHSTIMNMVLKFGTPPTRWSTVINIVISKEGTTPGQPCTRIIQKLEADNNQSLLIAFTKPITHHIDKHNIHHTSQYSDHQQQCTSSVLYKDLQCEYARINKTSLTWMETDCTGCYDRMIPNTLLMNAQTMGASRNICIALGKVC